MKRILGIIIFLVGVVGLVISVGGAVLSWRFVDDVGRGLIDSLALTADSLDTVVDSLALTKTTVTQMNDGLGTVETTADNVAQTINDTRPLMGQVSDVASGQVPDSIEAFQGAVPNLAEAAEVIDRTLRTLSALQVNQDLGITRLSFDLGINYDPEVPFNESVTALGDSLDGLPEQLRTLDVYLAVTSDNLETISLNVHDLADNINTINSSMAEVNPLLDEYINTVLEVQTGIRQLQTNIELQLQTVKIALVVLFVWLALYQVLPLYLGWEMVTGERDRDEEETVVVEEQVEVASEG